MADSELLDGIKRDERGSLTAKVLGRHSNSHDIIVVHWFWRGAAGSSSMVGVKMKEWHTC